jgi:transforming growth factor-beta-induced protein
MKRKALLLLTVVLMLVMSVVGSVSAQSDDNIVDIASKNPSFSTLYAAIIAAGLADTLASADGQFTVFAPTDAAFNAVERANPGTLAALLADPKGALTTILTYHVVPGRLTAADVLAAKTLTTIQGEELAVSVKDGEAYVDGARILTTDVPAKNGVIHVINGVLLPKAITEPAAEEAPAPSAPAEATPVADTSSMTIAEIAVDAGFTELVDALSAAGLVSVFTQPGNYTVFAPTNEAFEALGDISLSKEELTKILLFHVVGDELTRDQIATDDYIPTLSDGRPLIVNRDGSNIIDISGAKFVTTNIQASNGIIHVIDKVIIP